QRDGNLGTMRLSQGARSLLQRGRAHVIGRCIDEIARKKGAGGSAPCCLGIRALRHRKADLGRVFGPIARICITAEQEGERGEVRILRRSSKMPVSRRQRSRQLAEGKRRRLLVAKAEKSACKHTVPVGDGK